MATNSKSTTILKNRLLTVEYRCIFWIEPMCTIFPKIGVFTPQNGWFIMETPIKSIKIDDLGVALFLETPTYLLFHWQQQAKSKAKCMNKPENNQFNKKIHQIPSLKLTVEHGWLEDDRFLLGPGLFSGANC